MAETIEGQVGQGKGNAAEVEKFGNSPEGGQYHFLDIMKSWFKTDRVSPVSVKRANELCFNDPASEDIYK